MSFMKQLEYDQNEINKVNFCQFSVLSPEEIEKRSVAEIVTQETYENDNPKIGGLFDARMVSFVVCLLIVWIQDYVLDILVILSGFIILYSFAIIF